MITKHQAGKHDQATHNRYKLARMIGGVLGAVALGSVGGALGAAASKEELGESNKLISLTGRAMGTVGGAKLGADLGEDAQKYIEGLLKQFDGVKEELEAPKED